MNAELKKHLETTVNALVNEDPAAAKKALHEYLRQKARALIVGESSDEEMKDVARSEEDHDEVEVEDEVEKFDDKEGKKDKKDKKDKEGDEEEKC